MPIRILVVFSLVCLLAANAFAADQDIVVTVRETGERFLVEATIKAPVSQQTAWDVLVDYDHMTSILSNLSASQVISRKGNHLIIKQEGVVRYGLLSHSFQVEREIRLEPMKRILTKNLSGSLKRMESEVRLKPSNNGPPVVIEYRAEFVFDSILAGLFAESFLNHEVEEQFQSMVAEMKRRDAQLISGASAQP
jgi:ribosome-associated toxin RatA of RatAB toxin-antitoxin module